MTPEIRTVGDIRVQVFDLRSEPVVLDSRAWTPSVQRDPLRADGVCLHQWDAPVGTSLRNRRIFGEPEALARRGLRVPAHIHVGVTQIGKVPVVSLAHPLERYLYGSDAANATHVALEVMGVFPFTEDQRTVHHTRITPELQAAMAVGLELAAELLDAWAPGRTEPWELITHRQTINGKGDHARCCGEAVVKMALEADLPLFFKPNPDRVFVPAWGRPWPASWRRHLRESPQESPSARCPAPSSPGGSPEVPATEQ